MIIKKNIGKSIWYKYKGISEILIRPFKNSKHFTGSNEDLGKEKFLYCIVDWKEFFEEDGKTLYKCTEEHKEYFYDYYDDIVIFVMQKLLGMQDKLVKEVKN